MPPGVRAAPGGGRAACAPAVAEPEGRARLEQHGQLPRGLVRHHHHVLRRPEFNQGVEALGHIRSVMPGVTRVNTPDACTWGEGGGGGGGGGGGRHAFMTAWPRATRVCTYQYTVVDSRPPRRGSNLSSPVSSPAMPSCALQLCCASLAGSACV